MRGWRWHLEDFADTVQVANVLANFKALRAVVSEMRSSLGGGVAEVSSKLHNGNAEGVKLGDKDVHVSLDLPTLSLMYSAEEQFESNDATLSYLALGSVFPLERDTKKTSKEVEKKLGKLLTKSSFNQMQVLGQFNLSFIIARHGSDLFIVDQHAAEEKTNYEKLQKSMTLNSQRLISPMQLDLTSSEELVVMENLHVFTKNGFELLVDNDAAPTHRVRIIALPWSKHTVFGVEDVRELCALLADQPGTMVTAPRRHSMLASRACRSAVMVGSALQVPQMTSIVRHLAVLDQPWNCPHGRPTMRHIVGLDILKVARSQAQ